MTMTTATTTGTDHAGTAFEMEIHELEGLKDEDDCWSLLASVAFSSRNPDEYSHLESIGKEMVGKCNGQPRAIKVLGGILKGKMKKTEWKSAFDGIPLQLFMDYDDFTPTLKRCFAYCTVFPKEYKLRRETLIQFWISGDNLVQGHTAGTTTVETIAGKYFLNLQLKSILLVSNEDEGISMEPTHVNLARLVRGQAYFHYDSDTSVARENRPTSSSSSAAAAAAAAVVDDSPDYIRHISCIYDISMKFEPLSRYVNLHTLLIVCSPGSIRAIYSDQVIPDDLFTNFPELRTLSLSGLPMQTPPVSIRELAKMRLLDLSHTLIEKIPDSTTAPCNQLLTLKLNDCVSLTELPNMENQINLRHLDINGSNNIKAMPQGTGKLVNLRSLSKFIVSGADGSQIQELRDLVHLSGNLSISGLQNVVESRDAREANLASKTSLRKLVLEWTAKFSEGRNKDVETDVLECLRACSNLEALDVVCYGGTAFPEWISLSHKLVRIALRNCRNCNSLPLLGQLPVLKVLSVEGMDGVKIVGVEFCGDVTPFPSLETLEFKNMARWEEWSFGSVKIIPNLRSLRLERCPKLKAVKAVMRKLEMLTINECQELTAFSLESLPELRELDIQHCSNLNDMPRSFPSLTKLRIWGCRNLRLLSNTDPAGKEFPRLLELDIQNCTSLRELPWEFPLLEKLRITKCTKLSTISTCPKLADFVLEECDELALLNEVELGSLTSMVISHLPNFEYPRAQLLKCLLKLINLEISKCANLKALTDENGECGSQQALSSLQRLVIDGCPKLKQLPDHISSCFPSLTELIVVGCEGLEYFPNTALPENLKRLVIGRCTTLESLPPTIFTTGLEFVEVYGCPSLVSLSDNGNKRPLTLRSLSVSDCASLTSLPAGLNRRNTSLTSLRIRDCRSVRNFPQEGLPCNIGSLTIINCRNLKPLSEWRCLHELECLRNFSFGGCPELVDFEKVELPNLIGSILLKGLPKLKSLSGLLHAGLVSLDILTIRDCPNLETMTHQEKLSASLSCLYVSNCPTLALRCRNVEGEEWSKISHIPLIEFDFHQHVRKTRWNRFNTSVL
ncbi:hypothetical protein ACP275_02G125600 [Erythranthe tilingii]